MAGCDTTKSKIAGMTGHSHKGKGHHSPDEQVVTGHPSDWIPAVEGKPTSRGVSHVGDKSGSKN
jgi:hypothetical protein